MKRSNGRTWPRVSRCAAAAVLASMVGACGETPTPPPEPGVPLTLTLSLEDFAALDAAQDGAYEAWLTAADGSTHSAGRFTVSGTGSDQIVLTTQLRAPTAVALTLEPPGPDDGQPAPQRILGGDFQAGIATLDYISHLTAGLPFVEAPGSHKLFTPSDNAATGYPSNEDAGMWLFQAAPGASGSAAFWLDFMPLRPEWTYEGWVVLDYGSPDEIWFSYGKFEIDIDKQAKFEDDTGFGPFSGLLDYREDPADLIAMPGDDWVANASGAPLPGGLPDSVLPFDLNGCAESSCRDFWRGPSRFTHVITVEPVTDLGEEPWLARPFFVAPYRNAIGEGSPNTDRLIEYFPDELPSGTVTIGF